MAEHKLVCEPCLDGEHADDGTGQHCPCCGVWVNAKQIKYKFRYYVHDNYSVGELVEYLSDETQGPNLPKHIAEEIAEQRPFYEVTLDCEYDVDKGTVTILGAS